MQTAARFGAAVACRPEVVGSDHPHRRIGVLRNAVEIGIEQALEEIDHNPVSLRSAKLSCRRLDDDRVQHGCADGDGGDRGEKRIDKSTHGLLLLMRDSPGRGEGQKWSVSVAGRR